MSSKYKAIKNRISSSSQYGNTQDYELIHSVAADKSRVNLLLRWKTDCIATTIGHRTVCEYECLSKRVATKCNPVSSRNTRLPSSTTICHTIDTSIDQHL